MNIVVYDPKNGQRICNLDSFHKDVVSFGRQSDNDIVLNHDFVSRVHGVIYREGQEYFIEDLNSTNGIFVNGAHVKKSRLKNGDRVILARSKEDSNCVQFLVQENVMEQQPQQMSYYQNPYGNGRETNANINYQMSPVNSFVKMKTDRSMVLFFVFSLFTLGIYKIYFYCVLGSDVNFICSRRDGKKQMHYLIATWLLSGITLGIVPLIWHITLSERIGEEAKNRGIQTSFGAVTFWLWDILGILIIVGPFIYMYKLCKVMNQICEDYNKRGY